jgi:hypothetical protein
MAGRLLLNTKVLYPTTPHIGQEPQYSAQSPAITTTEVLLIDNRTTQQLSRLHKSGNHHHPRNEVSSHRRELDKVWSSHSGNNKS